jgi:hypothetical protein
MRSPNRHAPGDALLRSADPGTLAVGTCAEAKDDLVTAAASIPGERPLLMVDIDGVLSLWGFPRDTPPEGSVHFIEGIPHFLSATAARHLLALVPDFDLVWCSGWEERADEHLPHLLGLPRGLPHLRFERAVGAGRSLHGHWKLAAIDAHARERPLAWIDDCLDAGCHAWAVARPAPTLLVQTAPAQGLTQPQTTQLRRWAAALAET